MPVIALPAPTEIQLSRKQRTAAEARAVGLTIRQCAEAAGVNPSTVTRWLAPGSPVALAVDSLRDAVAHEGVARLRGLVSRAADVVAELTESQDERIRLEASKLVLSSVLKVQELADARARYATLSDAELESMRQRLISQLPHAQQVVDVGSAPVSEPQAP